MSIFSQRDYLVIVAIGIFIFGFAELGVGKIDRWIYRIYAAIFTICAILGFKYSHIYPYFDWVPIFLGGLLVMFTTFGDFGGTKFRRPNIQDIRPISINIASAGIISTLLLLI